MEPSNVGLDSFTLEERKNLPYKVKVLERVNKIEGSRR